MEASESRRNGEIRKLNIEIMAYQRNGGEMANNGNQMAKTKAGNNGNGVRNQLKLMAWRFSQRK
jgi:hypothetical protein